MPDGTQLAQGAHRRLPAVRATDATPRRVVEVDARIFAQILDVIERVLDQAGDRPVVAGRSHDDGVGVTQRTYQLESLWGAL